MATRRWVWILATAWWVTGCVGDTTDTGTDTTATDTMTSADTSVPGDTGATGDTVTSDTVTPTTRWQPMPGLTWQWQLDGAVDTTVDVEAYDIDLFDVSDATLDALRADGRKVICYFSAGSHEDWRDDAGQFEAADIGEPLEGWPGERWLDVRQAGVRQIMAARLDLAATRGCDAVEPDNVDVHAQQTGFELTEADARDYLAFLSEQAHARGLAVGLKNAVEIIDDDLVAAFDFAVNEECASYNECALLQPFVAADKAVLHVEYVDEPSQAEDALQYACNAVGSEGFSTMIKTWALDAFRLACP